MKRFVLLSLSILVVACGDDSVASTGPDDSVAPTGPITGVYLGSGTATNTGCTDPEANTTFSGSLRLEITEQTGSSFTGNNTFSFTFQGVDFDSVAQLEGTVNGSEISGTVQASGAGAQSVGTFTGTVTDTSISFAAVTNDTVGDSCRTTSQGSGTKQQ